MNRAFGGDTRAFRGALGILWDKQDVRVVEVEQGKLGRLLQRLGYALCRSARADRQQQRDLDRGSGCPGDAGPARQSAATTAATVAREQQRHGQARESGSDGAALATGTERKAHVPFCSRARRSCGRPWPLAPGRTL